MLTLKWYTNIDNFSGSDSMLHCRYFCKSKFNILGGDKERILTMNEKIIDFQKKLTLWKRPYKNDASNNKWFCCWTWFIMFFLFLYIPIKFENRTFWTIFWNLFFPKRFRAVFTHLLNIYKSATSFNWLEKIIYNRTDADLLVNFI